MATTTTTVKRLRDLSIGQKIAVGAGTAATLYALYAFATRTRQNVKKAPVDYGQIPYVYNSAGQPVKWDPAPLAKEIFENFEGWNFYTYPETTDKIQKLNNDQLRLLYNHYNTYFAQEYPTLTKLLQNEWTDWGSSYESAVAKLKGMGLNEGVNLQLNPNLYRTKLRPDHFRLSEEDPKGWQRFIQAFTDEDKAFNFPVKYPAVDFDGATKNMFYTTAGIFSAGLILAAIIRKPK